MAIVIKTDNKWRQFKYGYELPKKWRKQFDYMNDEEFLSSNFAYYNKQYYSIQDFMAFRPSAQTKPFTLWHGYTNDTYFSGVLIKVSSDGERYKIGRYMISEGFDEHAPDVGEGEY